jgi:chaperonin GroES
MKKINIQPLNDKVLLKEVKDEVIKTKSGIILPDQENKDMKKGEVIAVGSGTYRDGKLVPLGVRPGDVVMYSWGDKLIHEGVEYVLVQEAGILAIVK